MTTDMIPATDAATDDTLISAWISADKQSQIDMSGATASAAVGELLEQCSSDEERATILAGSLLVADEEGS